MYFRSFNFEHFNEDSFNKFNSDLEKQTLSLESSIDNDNLILDSASRELYLLNTELHTLDAISDSVTNNISKEHFESAAIIINNIKNKYNLKTYSTISKEDFIKKDIYNYTIEEAEKTKKSIWEKIKAAFLWLWNMIKSVFSKIGEFIKGLWNKIFGGEKEAANLPKENKDTIEADTSSIPQQGAPSASSESYYSSETLYDPSDGLKKASKEEIKKAQESGSGGKKIGLLGIIAPNNLNGFKLDYEEFDKLLAIPNQAIMASDLVNIIVCKSIYTETDDFSNKLKKYFNLDIKENLNTANLPKGYEEKLLRLAKITKTEIASSIKKDLDKRNSLIEQINNSNLLRFNFINSLEIKNESKYDQGVYDFIKSSNYKHGAFKFSYNNKYKKIDGLTKVKKLDSHEAHAILLSLKNNMKSFDDSYKKAINEIKKNEITPKQLEEMNKRGGTIVFNVFKTEFSIMMDIYKNFIQSMSSLTKYNSFIINQVIEYIKLSRS